MRGNNLEAVCQSLTQEWLSTELHNPDRCLGDISNIDGKLRCLPNKAPSTDALEDKFNPGSDPGTLWAPVQAANWQLRHESWGFKDGAPEAIGALAQTSDGFLWLAGTSGLHRFDGRQFELFHSPFGEELLSTKIGSLYAPPTGGLWIGYMFGGASFLENGRVKNYGGEFAANSGSIGVIIQDKDGIVWAASYSSGLWRFDHSRWEQIGTEWNVPKRVIDLALDQDGNIRVRGERVVLSLPRGSHRFQVEKDNFPASMAFAHESALVDREANVWVSSRRQGLERFFYSPLVDSNIPPDEGTGFAIAASDENSVLVGSSGGHLYRVTRGKLRVFPKTLASFIDFIYRAPDTTFWLGSESGLWHESLSHHHPSRNPGEGKARFAVREELWRFTGREWTTFDLPREIGDKGRYLQAITQDRFGGMWASMGRLGLYRLSGKAWTPYGGREDLPKSGVICEFTDSHGRVWFGYTGNQLAVLDNDHVEVLGPGNGIRVGNVLAIHGRGSTIWIGGEHGLEQFDAGRFKSLKAVNNDWLLGISGIVETANGDLWLNGITGIFHISKSELTEAMREPSYQVKGEHFGRREGLPGVASDLKPLPSAMESTDGRLWFAENEGVVWLDPAHVKQQVKPARVVIESISAGDKTYEPTFPLRLPAHTSSVQINYRAISLSNPEAIRFRYQLQETDPDWRDVSAAVQVSYRNLSPGSYHFRVNSTDLNGKWSDSVATAEFTIAPAFYQSRWFTALCAVAAMLFLYTLYLLRLRQVAKQFEVRMEERVGERTRIARELHDTLLQSLHGLMFQFQAARNLLPRRPQDAMSALDDTITETEKALAESRNTIQGLRSEPITKRNLADMLMATSHEFANSRGEDRQRPAFDLIEEGVRRTLSPTANDEVCQIARELLRNALRHARATRVEAEIRYDDRALRVRIRDNGIGIDPNVLKEGGIAGHWGLRGMRERADRIGAQLDFWSEAGAGTEVQLTVPASVAYEASRDGIGSRLFRRARWHEPKTQG